ncbi:MAG: molybdopterin-dependent oxidoreductase [Hydrogenophaga sp.]|uniref:nitrate reductase n=1 Tax=Hydrogenophaga sp. TaxID=1904254 RepID=UPI002727BDF3|nr:nitrate reductase [Hydrogenophaga sp.]MDO9147611.1 molybdopterin-dependent oxidoreductase [Hydrogenophaga sp.]MDO9605664.1 molybdopterin-dependent oxidoreductase [Hydrogenophaga sp.]MDP2163637.1 molybdopterin-dependent oxidoreductase [Hydrogenophaga sp.]MDP3476017.1 molybdopterin-dependent oxidoreductase [Hydrogenophaga sp.]
MALHAGSGPHPHPLPGGEGVKAITRSTCPYCGVGCGVLIETEGHQITGVRGDPDHPANFGKLCTKGTTLHLTATPAVTRQTRLLQPMQRLQRGQAPVAMAWEAALDLAADRFATTIANHGPDAVGFYISGQLLTEDYYVFNKLAKGLIGTNNVDTNSRLCMSSAVAGYKLTLGADAPTACYDDVNHATCLFIVGSNAAFAHPVLFRRIEEAKKKNPAMKVIVADPRRTDTAGLADLYLPLQPGSDVMLFHGLLHIMLWEGWIKPDYIAAHTTGFEALKALVRDCTPERVADVCGLKTEDLYTAAKWFAGLDGQGFATAHATLSLYCQGLNQSSSGTAKNATLINLHLATGQIGKPGAGPFSLTGQPNAMGGREVGGLANLLSAHRDLANPAHRAEVAALWGVPSVPEKPGKTAVEMFQAAADGEIKALWIACTNPAQSMPDQTTVRRALERAEFVVVQEAYATASTCDWADLLLPATTWGEKEGTVTNSERRISRVRAAVPAPGEARHDWQIVVDFAQRLERSNGANGVRSEFRTTAPEAANKLQRNSALTPFVEQPEKTLFPYNTPEAIWLEHRESTRGRDLDITGLSWQVLEQQGPQQWPLREGETVGKARLYEDGVFPTPDGRARFAALPWQPLAEPRESRYPFSLTTGRLRDQWHGMTRTGTLGRLFGHVAEPVVQLHPQDMARRGLAGGDLVHVTSKRGSILVPVQASSELGLSQAFMAMHWGAEYLSGVSSTGEPLAGVNALTTSAYCPTSKQPELKHAAVKVLKAELPWTLLGMAWLPGDQALSARESLRALMAQFSFASCVPFGRERTGVLFRAAAHEAPESALIERIEALLGLNTPDALRYADRRLGQRRTARLVKQDDTSTLDGFVLAGDTRAEIWIKPLLEDQRPAAAYGRQLLMPGARAPLAVVAKSRQVCTCFNVNEDAIQVQLQRCEGTPGERLASLQGSLQCGTHCGSCLPELRRLVRAQTLVEQAAEAS